MLLDWVKFTGNTVFVLWERGCDRLQWLMPSQFGRSDHKRDEQQKLF